MTKRNKWFLKGGRGSGKTFRLLWETYENKIANLEKENAELKELKKKKEEIEIMTNFCKTCKKMHIDQLAKAIGIIKRWYETNRSACIEPSQELIEVTEQFLKEIEK